MKFPPGAAGTSPQQSSHRVASSRSRNPDFSAADPKWSRTPSSIDSFDKALCQCPWVLASISRREGEEASTKPTYAPPSPSAVMSSLPSGLKRTKLA